MVAVRWTDNDRLIDRLVHLADDDDAYGETVCGWNYRLASGPSTRLRAKIVNETPTCLWCVAGKCG